MNELANRLGYRSVPYLSENHCEIEGAMRGWYEQDCWLAEAAGSDSETRSHSDRTKTSNISTVVGAYISVWPGRERCMREARRRPK
jgi:hypothetical protein